jgi:hypothetical protein
MANTGMSYDALQRAIYGLLASGRVIEFSQGRTGWLKLAEQSGNEQGGDESDVFVVKSRDSPAVPQSTLKKPKAEQHSDHADVFVVSVKKFCESCGKPFWTSVPDWPYCDKCSKEEGLQKPRANAVIVPSQASNPDNAPGMGPAILKALEGRSRVSTDTLANLTHTDRDIVHKWLVRFVAAGTVVEETGTGRNNKAIKVYSLAPNGTAGTSEVMGGETSERKTPLRAQGPYDGNKGPFDTPGGPFGL